MALFAQPLGLPRLRRSAIALLAVVLVAVGAMAIRATITVDAARHEVEDGLTALTGVPLRLGGGATVRLLPWPSVRFERVSLERADDSRVVARMDALDVSLDVAALVLGRLRPEELRLVRPEVRLDDAEIRPTIAALATLLPGWKPITMTVEKGRLIVASASGEETLDAIDARLAWPRPSANLSLRAGFRWRGESVGLDVDGPSPVRLVQGESGPTSLRLTAAPLRLTFSGTGGLLLPPRFEGNGDVEIVDAARFARWTGRPRTRDLLAGRWRLDGHLTADGRGVTLPSARLDLAGNKAEGTLTLRWDGARPRLSGTLAFADLDLSGERRHPLGRGWRDLAIDRNAQPQDLDLRLSTPSLKIAGLALSRVALALHAAEGRVRAEIGSAELFAKPVAATLRGSLGPGGLEALVRATGDDLPLADLATRLEIPGVEAGRATAVLDGAVRCATLGACASAIDGHLRIDARATRVTGATPFADM
jgi:AsmA protein